MDFQFDSLRSARLGELISAFAACNPEADVYYDFAYLSPTKPASWRGVYAELALGWASDRGSWLKVSEVLAWLREANGHLYEGYKGGTYRMGLSTPVWVDNWGQYSSTAIAGLTLLYSGGTVMINTFHRD